VPPGVCVYAIGDIHGRADLLRALHAQIANDAALLTPGTQRIAVYIGDYIDRGLESRQVIELLIRESLAEFHSVYLVGNHDNWLISFLIDARIGPTWLGCGGVATLHSYGIGLTEPAGSRRHYEDLRAALRERIPREHVEFFAQLQLSYEVGDYLFAHAGVRPAVPLDRQKAEDLLLIREPFLSSPHDFGKVVVHGHTVAAEPTVRSNRIGIDTGACWTGCLTCLVLEEDRYRLLSTAR
jgi:serine/threonine protein phosphatase 1